MTADGKLTRLFSAAHVRRLVASVNAIAVSQVGLFSIVLLRGHPDMISAFKGEGGHGKVDLEREVA